jgi:hypothetical protein
MWQKEYILKPVAKDNANYDTIGFCYHHCEGELDSGKMSRMLTKEPWKRLRGVRRDFLERVEWRAEAVRTISHQMLSDFN